MPKIMTLGNCTCDGWINSAQDLSDRIVNSSIEFPVGGIPMFDFCPYCGRKLVVAGAGSKITATWENKPLLEYTHPELIDIIVRMKGDISVRLTALEEILDKLGGS